MKKVILVIISLLFMGSILACDEATTTTTTTETTTSTSTTTTTTTTTTLSTTNISNIVVEGYSSNASLTFSDIATKIQPWNEGSKGTLTISIDDLVEYQPWGGTGAALTYSSAWVIDQSPSRDDIISYLFGSDGLNIQLVRLCVGASDFVTPEIGHYSYNDTLGNEPDPTLEQFSIAKDQVIIDVIKDALEINPSLVFMAAPWSAPAWMKTTDSLYQGSLRPIYYEAYANYLIKFIQAYADEGITISYLSVQNEPYYASYEYPGMTWTIDNTRRFVGDYLGPMLEAAGLTTKIMIWDHNPVDNNGNLIEFPTKVLLDEEAANYVDAVGIHCYTGDDSDMYDYLDYLRENAPQLEVYMTECTAITTYQAIESNMEWSLRRMYLEPYNRFAMGTTYWNMVMDPLGQTHLGGCSNCTGLLSVPTNGSTGFELEADALVTAHFSRYIALGAKRIETSTNNATLLATAFRGDDSTITLVVFNDGTNRKVTIEWQDHYFIVELPKSSLTTLVWKTQP